MGEDIADLVEAAQPNALLLRTNALASARDWEALVDLAQRCRDAVERGKQLWPIAEHIDYRLALEGPGEYAGAVITPEAGRFAHGPLTEVAASTHAFDEVAPYLKVPQALGVFAAERVIRGEDLSERSEAHPEILELPMFLADWEPSYLLPTFKADGVEVPSPEFQSSIQASRGNTGTSLDEGEVVQALLDLVSIWVAESGATAEAVVVEGDARTAIATLGDKRFFASGITSAEAFSYMAWAGAAGGVHGRRRGGAAGRFGSWWAAALLTGCDWPADPRELGELSSGLNWYRWEPRKMPAGWGFHLAGEDPADGWAFAIGALDPTREDPETTQEGSLRGHERPATPGTEERLTKKEP